MKKLDIKRALAEHNMSQVELARRSGVNPPNISAIIKEGNPTIARLTKIAEGIGCDITDLFYPDPAEELAEREKAIESAKNSKMPLELILRDLTRRAYPGITKEETDEWIEVIRKKNMVPWFDMGPSRSNLQNTMDNLRRLEEARKKHEGEGIGARLTSVETGWIKGETALDAVLNGDNLQGNEPQGGAAKVETFCPHCGKRVRVGVVLLEQC